ncbi:transposase [Aminobacter aminovorans]|nr:transposase [Aminobacter aminovorans]
MVLDQLPAASHLIADRGYDSAWFRQALTDKGIVACIPSSRSRKTPFPHDKAIYRQRHKVENLFAKLKDWRRIATRYDRCAHTFFSAICIAATMIFWINES